MEKHTLEPFYNSDSKILILGSFPSIKSREIGFYYSHPQNRFWKVLAHTFNEEIPNSIEEKKELLKRNKIALFDVCATCDIKASSDASIKNVVPNNLEEIFNNSKIKVIAFDGKTAYNLYQKYFKDKYDVELISLPSTSPANATWDMQRLINEYRVLNKY
ncbi:MAG: DNA-deoxyinosine glycosylase [Bacilli bacterium]|jgi:hypoxanthine-DNA glycosylase|nr:DNA-deoxyinosine glycosylase [Bacilli bacterium]